MFVCVVKNTVREGMKEQYLEVTRKFASEMEQVAGCLKTYVLCDTEHENVVVNVEIWESAEAKEADTGEVFMKYKPELKPCFLSNRSESYIIA